VKIKNPAHSEALLWQIAPLPASQEPASKQATAGQGSKTLAIIETGAAKLDWREVFFL
jgi:hypothetical protein